MSWHVGFFLFLNFLGWHCLNTNRSHLNTTFHRNLRLLVYKLLIFPKVLLDYRRRLRIGLNSTWTFRSRSRLFSIASRSSFNNHVSEVLTCSTLRFSSSWSALASIICGFVMLRSRRLRLNYLRVAFEFFSSWIVCVTLLIVISTWYSFRHRQYFVICVKHELAWSWSCRSFCIAVHIVNYVGHLSLKKTSYLSQSKVRLLKYCWLIFFLRVQIKFIRSISLSSWSWNSTIHLLIKIRLLNLWVVKCCSVAWRGRISFANEPRHSWLCISFCIQILFIFLFVIYFMSLCSLSSISVCVCSPIVLIIF